jgi:AcrR family transcriptional regulator
LRAEQAEGTRRRILEAATRLFLERGYGGTTINAVAAEADVSPETIYASVGGKKGLLEGVIDDQITAYLAPFFDPEHDRSSRWAEIDRLPTAQQRLRAWVELACELLAHTSPIHSVIRGAGDSEPFAVQLRRRLLQERIANMTAMLARYMTGSLRPGLTIDEAAQRACALASPELRNLLIVEMGWTPEQHRAWLGDLLEAEVLGKSRR